MISFNIEKPRKANFTPSSLIYEWCKSKGLEYKMTFFFEQYVTVNGLDYKYDHWCIQPKDEETNIITVYLRLF